MPSTTTTDRPFLIKNDGASAVCAIRESSDRSPRADFLFLDDWFIRTADWLAASQTQPRSGDSQPAGGGTIFFEALHESAQDFQSDTELSLPAIEDEQWTDQRVVLWMRADDPTLRSVTIDGPTLALNTQLTPKEIERLQPDPWSAEHSQAVAADTVWPLRVWTLWSNPFAE